MKTVSKIVGHGPLLKSPHTVDQVNAIPFLDYLTQ